jgi:hypothetical protein
MPSHSSLSLIAALALTPFAFGCGEDDGKTTGDDTGASGGDDGGDDSAYVYDPDSVEVLASMQITTEAERPWRIDLQLEGDDLFSERFGSADVRISTGGGTGTGTSEEATVTTTLRLDSIEKELVGPTTLQPGEGEGEVLTAFVVEGEGASLTLTAPLEAVECVDNTCALPMVGHMSVPGSDLSTAVAMGIDPGAGELRVRLSDPFDDTTMGDVGGTMVYGMAMLNAEPEVHIDVESMSFGSGDDLPTTALEDGTQLEVTVTLYDRDGAPAGGVAVQAMYGDIIMGSLPLDDFFD